MSQSRPADGRVGTVRPGRHDPEGRKRLIVSAAAALIAEVGTAKVTHRLVAERAGVSLGSTTRYFTSLDDLIGSALRQLAAEIDADLEELRDLIEANGFGPEQITQYVHDFLSDAESVRINIEMITAAISDPSVRTLAKRWSEGLRGVLADHIGSEAALAVVTIVDGASAHAALNDAPIDLEVLQRIITAVVQLPRS